MTVKPRCRLPCVQVCSGAGKRVQIAWSLAINILLILILGTVRSFVCMYVVRGPLQVKIEARCFSKSEVVWHFWF